MIASSTTSAWDLISSHEVFDRLDSACVLHDGRFVFVAGGSDGQRLRTAAVYDIEMDSIRELPNLPCNMEQTCGGAIMNDHFYVAGDNGIYRIPVSGGEDWEPVYHAGDSSNIVETVVSNGASIFVLRDDQTMLCYDSQNEDDPIKLIPMSRKADSYSAAIVDNKIYVLGGHRYPNVLTSVDVFDISTELWSSGPPLPKPVAAAGTTVIKRWIVVVGGQTAKNVKSDCTFVFDTLTQEWTTRDKDLSLITSYHRCDKIGSQILSMAGYGGKLKKIHARKIVPNWNWECIKHFVLLRTLWEYGRALNVSLSIEDEKDSRADDDILPKIMTDLNLDMFREVLTYL